MRLRIQRTQNDAHYYAIESTYSEGKHSSKVVMKLGLESEIRKEHPEPEKWAREYLAELTKKEKEEGGAVRIDFHPQEQMKLGEQSTWNGGYLFLQQIYSNLGLDKICAQIARRHSFDYDLNSILSRLLYGRILQPGSKLSTCEFSGRLLEKPNFQQHQVYRALSVLAEESDFIQAELYRRSKKLGERNDKRLYYDCTNYYFEIEMEADDKQYGHSKENRPNPIIQMGLMMDGDGIPLAYCIHPGNTNEQTTLRPLEQQIIRDFDHREFVVCTDAGLSSSANRLFNSLGGRRFITAQSLKQLPQPLQEWALSPKGWHLPDDRKEYDLNTVLSDEKQYTAFHDAVFVKEQSYTLKDVPQRFIVTFSIKYMEYLRTVRSRQVKRAQKIIDVPSDMQKNRPTDCKRFIQQTFLTEDGEIANAHQVTLDVEKIADEERFDGFYAVATNLEDSVQKIIRINRRRWEIEECFRIMKHEFKARPVYLQRKDRIRAHFLTCFLALTLFRYLEKQLNCRFTVEQIISTLADMSFHEIPGSGFVPCYTRTEITDALHHAFDFRTDSQLIPISAMKKIFTRTKKAEQLLK